ncbi:MAG TPA: DUF4190 domain-containing protein [Chthoniobacteraceae bacterium]|jgi:hypothetical protein
MSAAQEKHFLLWKGKQSGPFGLEEIETKLRSGEISRMHQISVNGGWQVLDDFLERFRQPRPATQKLAEHSPVLAEERSALAHLLPKSATAPAPAPGPLEPTAFDLAFATPPFAPRISPFAIVALISALCTLVPYVWFVSWIPALVFGHVALVQINRDLLLRGRAMAIGALILTYFLLILGGTFLGLMVMNHQKLPF